MVLDLCVDSKASFSLSYFYCWVWYHILIYIFKFCFCFSCPFFYSLVNAFLNNSMLWNLCRFLIIHLLSMLNVSIVTFRLKNKKKMWIQFDWRFRMILRLYIEIWWAVSQLVGVYLIWFILLFTIFKFSYMNVEWRYK